MRLALKITIIFLSWGFLALAILIQVFPVEWQQQSWQLTKVVRAVLIVPPKPAKLPKPKLLSKHDLVHILRRAGWPRKLHGKAARVIFCESGLDPQVVGKENPMDIGLFQINIDAHGGRIKGSTVAQKKKNLKNPDTNARIALEVYRESRGFKKSGWKPWEASIRCHGLV